MTHALPELLAPAGSPEALTAAIRCGADAVYLGAQRFSARQAAENFDASALQAAADACHLSGVRLYLAINTLLLPQEFSELDKLLQAAVAVGVDACIVQDFGLAAYLRRRVPNLPLHASTQCSIHSAAGVAQAAELGFSRVILARELSGETLAALCRTADACGVETEVFVHGAHCMSVSGQCWMSAAMGGRSANRGCCAQPCRLPYQTDASAPLAHPLSLKDRCLVTQVTDLCAMGVRSLKIEGRMKRPEYVAAAVTAYRKALRGETPDVQELRAVFSRSGFTDGYYTNQRVQMTGIRQKEDVLAAQDVLGALRLRYQKPEKVTTLDAAYTLLQDQPSTLTVRDGDGLTVSVTGEIPQHARQRATDLEQLQKQFYRLGDTVYTPGTVTATLDGVSMLPVSALNALRRDAVREMDLCRTQAHTPRYELQPATPVSVRQTAPMHSGNPRLRLQVRRLSQLSLLTKQAELTALDAFMLPLRDAEAYATLPQLPLPLERCILVPPRWMVDEAQVAQMLKAARTYGFARLACSNLAHCALGKRMGYRLHGDLGLHITNAETIAALRALGLTDGLLSPEVGETDANALADAVFLGRMVYGKLPLMLTRNCPLQAQVGCQNCKHLLLDRKGMPIYTDCVRYADAPDYAELMNPACLWLPDRLREYQTAAYHLLLMTDETPERVRDVWQTYAAPQTAQTVEKPLHYTRGLRLTALPTGSADAPSRSHTH